MQLENLDRTAVLHSLHLWKANFFPLFARRMKVAEAAKDSRHEKHDEDIKLTRGELGHYQLG